MKLGSEDDPVIDMEHQLLDDEVNSKSKADSFSKPKEEEAAPVTECD